MKKIIIFFFTIVQLLKADEEVLKLLVDLTTSDINKFEKNILKGVTLNKDYYESKFKELEVVIVIHGEAYKFFLKNLLSSAYKKDKKLLKVAKEFRIRIKSLHDIYDVKFLICAAGMNSRLLKKEDIFDFVELTPNAMIALIDTQNDGFAYIPVR